MDKLVYSEEELLRSHDYASPHVEAGRRLHGGFDADGGYVPPRMLERAPAIEHWTTALRDAGGELMDADASLLEGVRYPTVEQSKVLLQEGLGQSFWNNLTITGKIEGRGRILADMQFPDFQSVVVQDIHDKALGHLHKGLLKAHGLDEGGQPDEGIGGHDVMWFALRDLAFGETDYPDPVVPENIGRPEADQRTRPAISPPHLQTMYFLLNLLLIEFRAEIGFANAQALLRDPELFRDRREEALHAAEIVERIRTDEAIHVSSLRLYLGEIRSLDFKTTDGGTLPGREIIDGFWQEISHWARVEQPRLAARQQREMYRERISQHPDAARIQRAFDGFEDSGMRQIA